MPNGLSSCSQEKDVNKRRIEKEKERKDKESRKKYEQAILRHKKIQSAETRSMMKKTKQESPKNTPLKHSSGKKCKWKQILLSLIDPLFRRNLYFNYQVEFIWNLF